VKVAICVPHYGDTVKAAFAHSLANLMAYVAANAQATGGAIEQQLFMKPGLLPMVRNELKDEALAWGADWLLWLDADMTFIPETLHQLLLDGQPIVGVNYLMRLGPAFTAFNIRGDKAERVETTQEKAEKRWLEAVDVVGAGVLLVAAEVFRKLSLKPFRFGERADGQTMGEDTMFMIEAKAAGFQPHVDHALSWHCGHVVPMIKRPRRD